MLHPRWRLSISWPTPVFPRRAGGGLKTGECELPLCLDLSGLNCHTSTKSLAEFFSSSYPPAFLSFSALGKTLLAVHMWSGGCGKISDLLGCLRYFLFSSV